MAIGFPTKANWAAGDVLTASAQDDLAGTVNLLSNASAATGTTLISNAAGTSFAWQSAYNGNAQINGAMDVWQRGTSFSGAGLYTADRWYSGVSNTTYSQESTIVPTGFQYSLKMTTTTTATAPTIWSAMETKDAIRFAGQTVTLSYYAASSDSVAAYIRLDYSTSVDTAISGSWTSIGTSTSATTPTMSRVQTTFSVPSTAKSLRLIIGANASLSNGGTFCITGVQLELGSIATTFKRAGGGTFQGELAACQRYYFRNTNTASGGGYGYLGLGIATSITAAEISTTLPVTMRTVPSSVDYSTVRVSDGVTGSGAATLTINTSGTFQNVGATTVSGVTGIVAYRPYFLQQNGSSTAYVGFNAEL